MGLLEARTYDARFGNSQFDAERPYQQSGDCLACHSLGTSEYYVGICIFILTVYYYVAVDEKSKCDSTPRYLHQAAVDATAKSARVPGCPVSLAWLDPSQHREIPYQK